ncbi:unnamed protein product, partial [Prorocentrum cordatum]
GTLIWTARAECPPCTCKPSLVCGAGQEARRLDCPAPAGAWPLSAVLLALVCGLGAGAALGRLLVPPAPTQTASRFERASDSMSAAAAAAAGHPFATLGLDEGDFMLIRYQVGGARIWHERLLLAFKATPPFGTGILTPDDHGYDEAITTGIIDVADLCVPAGGAAGGASAATGGDQVHCFRALPLPTAVADAASSTRASLGLALGPPVALNTAGRVIAAVVAASAAPIGGGGAGGPAAGGLAGLAAALGGGALRAGEAPPGGGAAGALVPAAAPAAALPGGALAPMVGTPAAGALQAAVPAAGAAAAAAPLATLAGAPGAPCVGAGGPANALAAAAAAPGGDARMQVVTLDPQGVHYIDFRAAVLRLHELPWADWPLKGPRTRLWVLNYIGRNGGTPLGRHLKWKAEAYLDEEVPGVDVHFLCCRLLEYGVVYDHAAATNLASMELVGRSLQTQELYRDRFAPSSEHDNDAALLSGVQDAGGSICMAPALRDWLAAEKSREAAIANERRKAREGRALAAGTGAAGSGSADGRGGRGRGGRGRQRDVFPLPVSLAAAPRGVGPVSRRSARRRGLRAHREDRVRAATNALNSLYGFESSPTAPAREGQRQAIMHIESSIEELGAPPPEFTDIRAAQDGALRELLSCANLCGSGAASPSPYVRDRVAWPAGSAAPVDLIDLVQPQDRAWLEGWRSHMLRDQRAAEALVQSACPRGPYCDPGLVRDASIYGQFLIQMYQRQMVTFAADNGMPHSEMGLIDLDFDPSTRVTPMVTVLPMGFSWALRFCQSAARAVLAASGHERAMTALDGQPGVVVTDPASVGVGAYVDNILALGADKSAVDRVMGQLVAAFRARGLPAHEIEPAAQDAEFLGLSLKHGRFRRIKPRNIWRLRAAISGLLRRGWCSGHMVRAVLGHVTWSSMIRREALAVLHSADSFEAAHGERQGIIWASAAKELVTIRDLLPLLSCDLASGWHRAMTAGDASPFGLGVMRRRAPRAACAAMGRCSERWRFKVEGGHQARIRSLREGGLDQPRPVSENVDMANVHSTSERLKPDVQHDSPASLHASSPFSGTFDASRDPQGQHGDPCGELMGQHVDPCEELMGQHEDPCDSMGQHGDPYEELMGFNGVLAQPPSGTTRAHPDAVLGDPWEMGE